MATHQQLIATEQLATLIAAKLEVLELLTRIANTQLSLIETGEMSTLLTVLTAKQQLISRMQSLESQLDPFRQEDPDTRVWSTPERRKQCQDHARRSEALLAEILLTEKRAEALMLSRRDQTARRLDSMHTAGEAGNAYATAGYSPITSTQLRCEG